MYVCKSLSMKNLSSMYVHMYVCRYETKDIYGRMYIRN